MSTQSQRFRDLLRELGIPFSNNWAPYNTLKKPFKKDEKLQQEVLDAGHNITVLATHGIQVGDLCFVFFTGAAGMEMGDPGEFMLVRNTKTGEVLHTTSSRRMIARPEPEEILDAMAHILDER